jgi:hypothetical protein
MINKFIILLFLPLCFFSQKPSTNKYEKRWAFWHPIAALKVKKVYNKAIMVYNDKELKNLTDTFISGGKHDAFRHTFFMAAFAQKVKIKKLRKLGVAHEKGNYKKYLLNKTEDGDRLDSLSSVMDLKNNELGFLIAEQIKKREITLPQLKLMVINQINAGNAFVFKRNTRGKYVDCKNTIIDFSKYVNVWHTPKCLVASNYMD